MKKFIESEIEKIQTTILNHKIGLSNALKQVSNFAESLIVESSGMENAEKTQHLVKGILAIDAYAKQNIQLITTLNDRSSSLTSTLALYEKNKKLAEKTLDENTRKFRKIGEKPEGIRQTRNVKKNIDLYQEEETPAKDS
jgi:hypothetical protein